jgi:hypothetical protein
MEVPVIPFHRPCWRLRAERTVSPLSRLAGSPEFGPLQDMIRRTAIPAMGSGFSDGSFRPVYAALEQRTCLAEMLHHWTRTFLQTGCPPGTPLRSVMLSLGIDGERFLDVRSGHDELHDPEAHQASRRFGLAARLAGEDGILYRSVRDPGGTCVAAIRPQVAGIPREDSELHLVWMGDRFQRTGG